MTSREKKVVFIIIAIMVVILVVVVIVKSTNKSDTKEVSQSNVTVNEEKYVTELTDGTKLNSSEALNSTHTYKSVEISNIQFTSQDGSSVLLADVKNTGSTAFAREEATLVLLGDNNEVVKEIPVVIPNLAAGATDEINSIVTADIVNVKDFRIEAAK